MGELSRVRLNVGCGDKHWPGWVNCDAYGSPDILTDCRKLPFDADYADEIQSIHFAEHVPRMDVDNMLADWHRVMKRGARLVIEVPSLNKIAENIVSGEKNMRLMQLGIFGDPRDPKPGMMHQWAYTKEELTEVVLQAGFAKVGVKEPVFHLAKRDMRLEAIKP
jgi:predicted SAM-dependent methyltransferase